MLRSNVGGGAYVYAGPQTGLARQRYGNGVVFLLKNYKNIADPAFCNRNEMFGLTDAPLVREGGQTGSIKKQRKPLWSAVPSAMSGVDLFLGAFLLASLLLAAFFVTLLVALLVAFLIALFVALFVALLVTLFVTLLVAFLLAAFYLVLLATFFLHGSLGGNGNGENGRQGHKYHFFHNETVFKRFMFYVLSAAKI